MKLKPSENAGGGVVELEAHETHLPLPAAEQALGALPVFKLKRILVPVDFSPCSKKALEYALSFSLGLIPRSLLRLYYKRDKVQHSGMPRSLLRGLFTREAV